MIMLLIAAASDWAPPVLAVVGVLGSGLITYLVSHRTHSGDIRQTPAEKLWDAAESIRSDLAKEVERLRAELLHANQRITSAEARIRELEARM